MNKIQDKSYLESQMTEICAKINEIHSFVNTIQSAANNEFDPPEIKDIVNSLAILSNYIEILQKNSNDFMKNFER